MNMLTFNQEGSNVMTIIRSGLIPTPWQAMLGMQAVYNYKECEFHVFRCIVFLHSNVAP